jgi:hypothetical protein
MRRGSERRRAMTWRNGSDLGRSGAAPVHDGEDPRVNTEILAFEWAS